jgi:hypothetical protein
VNVAFRLSSAVLVLVVLAATASAQPAPAARALVGEWVGGWRSATGSFGSLAISVDEVSGEQVRGSLFMVVSAPDTQGYYNRSVTFRGFFDGAILRITVPPALSFDVRVSGGLMSGTVQGQQTYGTVELKRK